MNQLSTDEIQLILIYVISIKLSISHREIVTRKVDGSLVQFLSIRNIEMNPICD